MAKGACKVRTLEAVFFAENVLALAAGADLVATEDLAAGAAVVFPLGLAPKLTAAKVDYQRMNKNNSNHFFNRNKKIREKIKR